MRWNFLAAGSVLLILASLTGAEYLGTTISTDGTLLLSGFGEDENGSSVSRVMTVGATQLSRIISGEESRVGLSVQSTGPVVFSDYSTGMTTSPAEPICVFLTSDRRVPGIGSDMSLMYTSGILEHGTYAINRVTGPGLSGETLINGSGLLFLGSETEGNRTAGSSGFVSGNMTVYDSAGL